MVISWGFVVEWGFMVMKKVPWLMGSSHGNYLGDGIFTDEPIFFTEGDRGIVHGSYEESHGLVRRKSYEGLSL